MVDVPDLMDFDDDWGLKIMQSFIEVNTVCYDILKEKLEDQSILLPEYFFLNLGFKRLPACFYLDFKSLYQKKLYLECQKQPVIVMGTISKEFDSILEL